jgi:integrase-like protein
MILLPPHLLNQYRSFCSRSAVVESALVDHVKWLRYFLDFCEKYQIVGDESERTRQFLEKLRQKGQHEDKRQQAARAVALYFAMVRTGGEAMAPVQVLSSPRQPSAAVASHARPSQFSVAGYQETSDSPEWDEVLGKLADEIKVRHYSRKTLQTYAKWSRSFQRFLKNKPPQELSTADVKEYLRAGQDDQGGKKPAGLGLK